MAKQRYFYGFTGGSMQVENKMFLAGKDATEALREGLDVNKHGMRMGDIMGMAVICSTIVPDNELWFIQNGKLIQKYVIEKNGGKRCYKNAAFVKGNLQ